MKNFFLLFILLAAQKECGNPETLPYLYTTSQEWVGGPAATRGTYYNIYLGMKKDSSYVFDSLWVNGKRLQVSVKRNSSDTLNLFVNDAQGFQNPVDHTDLPKSTEAKFPIDVTAAAVLGYLYKGERGYVPIPSFIELEAKIYR